MCDAVEQTFLLRSWTQRAACWVNVMTYSQILHCIGPDGSSLTDCPSKPQTARHGLVVNLQQATCLRIVSVLATISVTHVMLISVTDTGICSQLTHDWWSKSKAGSVCHKGLKLTDLAAKHGGKACPREHSSQNALLPDDLLGLGSPHGLLEDIHQPIPPTGLSLEVTVRPIVIHRPKPAQQCKQTLVCPCFVTTDQLLRPESCSSW